MKPIKPSYYSIIPANVRYDENISANAKLLYSEITALADKTGTCWAGNKYFSDLYKCRKETISRWISELQDNGYIETEYFKSGGKVEKRVITIDKKVNRKGGAVDKIINRAVDENVKGNTTSKAIALNKELNNGVGKNSTHYIKYFISKWELKLENKMISVNWGQMGANVKKILRDMTGEELKELIDNYFRSEDPFYIKSKYSWGVFMSAIDSLRVGELFPENNKDLWFKSKLPRLQKVINPYKYPVDIIRKLWDSCESESEFKKKIEEKK